MCESALKHQKNKSEPQNDTVVRKPASYIEIIEDEKEAIKCWKASRYFDHILDIYHHFCKQNIIFILLFLYYPVHLLDNGNSDSSMETVGQFGWCGTCYSTVPGEPGFCKQYGIPDNTTTKPIKDPDVVTPGRNPKEFSRPTPNENWGFCSENCLKLGHNNGYSEVN